MKPSWLLPPLAALFSAAALWIVFRARNVSPELLLESARAKLAAKSADRVGARRELDEALRLAPSAPAALRAEILDERAQLYAREGLPELALADCRARLEECGAEPDALERAATLCLQLGEAGLALELAKQLAALDLARGQCHIGRCHVALADSPLASLERLGRNVLPPSQLTLARTLAQRASVLADDENVRSSAQEELLELFARPDERRMVVEWVREAAEHLKAARAAFLASLTPGSTSEAVAGLQDLLLRAGAEREGAELGQVALALPDLAQRMPVLARTASALTALGREASARALILASKRRSPEGLSPAELPSLALRDELEEWCRLLERLGLWDELRSAAGELSRRADTDRGRAERAMLFAVTADLRKKSYYSAQRTLDLLAANTLSDPTLQVRLWQARAELARGQAHKAQERFALLALTRCAPLDPPEPLRAELGRAWLRLFELQEVEGDLLAAETSLTHALRCSAARLAELEPQWHAFGTRALAFAPLASSPYRLYLRAKRSEERALPDASITDARALLVEYPGLGPALELASSAAHRLQSFPLMIEASLELLERGWPSPAASARLRAVPKEYLLPQDRVRWMLCDPRGSLEVVVRRLLAQGDVQGAALAARGGPAKYQPPELLALLARTEYEAGQLLPAKETLALLPVESALFRASTGLLLKIGLALARSSARGEEELAPLLAQVLASGQAEDAELVPALDWLLAAGWQTEAEALLAWLAPQTPPFLGELLLRQSVAHRLAGTAERTTGNDDEALERAAALLEDGRPELGRLLIACGEELDQERGQGDEAAVARAARAVLATPLGREPARAVALLVLAGEYERAAEHLAAASFDGRDFLLELAGGCLSALAPEAHALNAARPPTLSAFLLESLPPRRVLALGLAAAVPPWSVWVLGRTGALAPAARADPIVVALRAQAALALGLVTGALAELAPDPELADARLAWLRVRSLRARGAGPDLVQAAELQWLAASGRSADTDPELAALQAAQAARSGAREEAVRILERALEQVPADLLLSERLAELENSPGRRTRALELYGKLLATEPARADDARVLAFLEVLRAARDEGEISEARWWAEVEALEAERPQDPAPVRALAERSFETAEPGNEHGRAHALERLARFRARTLERSIESLRPGEAQRWTRLLMRYTPERAVAFAEEELRRDPGDPVLWRTSAEALVAAGRPTSAFERLEALERVAPERETTRLLALTRFRLDDDAKALAERLARIARLDRGAEEDTVLSFYGALVGGGKKEGGVLRALELWRLRAENGLAEAEHGRALGIALFEARRRDAAVEVLGETLALARGALEQDVLAALMFLMRAAPAEPPRPSDAEVPASASDDVPDDAPDAASDAAPPSQGDAAQDDARQGKGGGKKNKVQKNSPNKKGREQPGKERAQDPALPK